MTLDYETGKLLERILQNQVETMNMLKTIGDMVYGIVPEDKNKRKAKKRTKEIEEFDEEDEFEEEKVSIRNLQK